MTLFQHYLPNVLPVLTHTPSIPISPAHSTANSLNPSSQTSISANQSATNLTARFAVNLIPTVARSVNPVNSFITEVASIPVQQLHTFSTMNALTASLSVLHALKKAHVHPVTYKTTNRFNYRFANAHRRHHFTPRNASKIVHISTPLLIKFAIEYALEVSSQYSPRIHRLNVTGLTLHPKISVPRISNKSQNSYRLIFKSTKIPFIPQLFPSKKHRLSATPMH